MDPVKEVTSHLGGVHGTLVTAVSTKAFAQEVVLKRLTIRGSIVGTRLDLAEALALAAEGQVKTTFSWDKLDNINAIFDRMRAGSIEGRVVLEI